MPNIIKKPKDFIGSHNIMSRMFMITFMGLLIYSYIADKNEMFLQVAAWLSFGAFALISVGVNSLETIGEIMVDFKSTK